jgi:hypothetical protein
MAKIIQLQKEKKHLKSSKQVDTFEDFMNWISEMNNILHLIEESLEKTPAYVPKSLNRRR